MSSRKALGVICLPKSLPSIWKLFSSHMAVCSLQAGTGLMGGEVGLTGLFRVVCKLLTR